MSITLGPAEVDLGELQGDEEVVARRGHDYFIVDRPDADGNMPEIIEVKASDRHPNRFYTMKEIFYKTQDGDKFFMDGRYENGVFTPPQPVKISLKE